MQGFLSQIISREEEINGVLSVKPNEVDFLFFKKGKQDIQVLLCGNEQSSRWDTQAILDKVLGLAKKQGRLQRIIVTFPSNQFRAQVIEETVPPTLAKHLITQKEAQKIEQQVSRRVQGRFQKFLFSETGILPNDFALRRVHILNRKIDGYRVENLAGYKHGEIRLSVLGVFLLEEPFAAVEQAARRHNIAEFHVFHIAEAMANFARQKRQEGIYLSVEEEYTQIALWRNGEFFFPGVVAMGGNNFVDFLQLHFGMHEQTAEELYKQSGKQLLSPQAQQKVTVSLLPELQKFGTLVKEKVSQIPLSLPETFWVFGKGGVINNLDTVFGERLEEDLPFGGKPALSLLLPGDVWEGVDFYGGQNSRYTPLCLLGAMSTFNTF